MKRVIGLAPSELDPATFLKRLVIERDRIRYALFNFVGKKPKKKVRVKKPKKTKKIQTLMQILESKGLTLDEAINAVKKERRGDKK